MEEPFEPKVRSEKGLIPWQKGLDLLEIRRWREAQTENEPRSLEDYYITHGICFDCRGHGAKMIGWSDPATDIDKQAAQELGLEQLPLYDVCPVCEGTGRTRK